MYDSKLIDLYKIIAPKHHKRLTKFVYSPYFNENVNVCRLHDFILTAAPDFADDNLTKEKAYEAVLDGAYDDLKMRHLMSDLLKPVERFIAQQEIEDDSNYINLKLLQRYRTEDLEKHFDGVMRRYQKRRDTSSVRDAAFFHDEYLIEQEASKYRFAKRRRSSKLSLQNNIRHLDHFYLVSKLQFCCYLVNFQNLMPADYDLLLLDEILHHIEQTDYSDVPAVAVYYRTLMMLMHGEDEAHFRQLKDLVERHSAVFSESEQRDLYYFELNYCIKRLNSGEEAYYSEALDLYKQMLDRKLLFKEGIMTHSTFKNIVEVALHNGEYEWTEFFIETYKVNLREDVRESIYSYTSARLKLDRKEFDDVLRLLQFVEYEDVFYSLGSKTMLLMTYYELNEMTPLLSLLDSFKVYLSRNKYLTDNRKRSYLNLVKYTRRATGIIPGENDKIEKTLNEIAETKLIARKEWLIEKLNALKK